MLENTSVSRERKAEIGLTHNVMYREVNYKKFIKIAYYEHYDEIC